MSGRQKEGGFTPAPLDGARVVSGEQIKLSDIKSSPFHCASGMAGFCEQ
jgi:hypothetical protein